MSDYDSEYYFIRKPKKDPKLPFLVPDKNTEGRRYGFAPQQPGSAPLVFTNGYKEENERDGITGITPNILFAGADLVVRTSIRDKLISEDIPHLSIHPAIYIDDKDHWHEDFWYLTFTEDFDCWDRKTSEYDDEDGDDLDDDDPVQVYSYRMNAELLDNIPLANRRLFKMGGELNGYVCCHKTLRSLFSGTDAGTMVVCLKDQ